MSKGNNSPLRSLFWCGAALVPLLLMAACAPGTQDTVAVSGTEVHVMPADQEYSGFLGDYSQLQPQPDLENTTAYVNRDEQKNLHHYLAIIIDPVQVYVATDDDPSLLEDRGKGAITNYFKLAMANAVVDAFAIVDEPGPLTLRLRTALVGVDIGDEAPANELPEGAEPLNRSINIGEVGLEMELVDSVTGERIAAAVNRTTLGEPAEIGSTRFAQVERYDAAQEIIDGWAAALRDFLDEAHELSEEEAQRAIESYRPYGGIQ